MDPVMEATEYLLGKNPAMLKFLTFFMIWLFSGITYLPASVPSLFSFRMKLRNHQLLLDQMSAFDVRAAKCTLQADRNAIEEHVVALFKGRNVPLKEGSGVDDGEARCFTCKEIEALRFDAEVQVEELGGRGFC